MSGGTKMLLTDVAGVVFLLVLLSLPPASMGCNGEGRSPFSLRERVRLMGKEKGVGGERLSRRMNEASNQASK